MKKKLLIIVLIVIVSTLSASSKWLGKDKIAHFTGSAFLTCWNYGLNKDFFELSHEDSIYLSVSVNLTLGFCKEYSDKHLKKTKFSWQDVVYDTAGIAAGLLLINTIR